MVCLLNTEEPFKISLMPHRSVLLVGGHRYDPEVVRSALDPALDVELHVAESLDELIETVSTQTIDTVVFGGDLDTDLRSEMIRRLASSNVEASIHVSTQSTDLVQLMPFVNGVLTGLTWHQWTWGNTSDSADLQVSPSTESTLPVMKRVGFLRRIWNYLFGRSEPPAHPPPPPYSPGAGV